MQAVCYNCFHYIPEDGVCPYCGHDPRPGAGEYRIALKPGTILANRYLIGRVLGQGGFGVTYVALDGQSRVRVAIKEYLPTEYVSREADGTSLMLNSQNQQADFNYGKQQFLAEARTLAEFVGSENIVNIHSFFEANGTAYFSMEFVEGVNLKKTLEQRGRPLPIYEVNKILLPIMEALDWVHSKGVVHRDISPDNIMIKRDGTAKLIDFGAARYSTGEKSKSLDVVLKYGFAPYEQYSRRGRQGAFTDVYAMAATYYYAITGKVPPDAVDRMDEDTLQLPSALGVKIRKNTEQVLIKALAVSYKDRYQKMSEFYAALIETMPLPFASTAGEEDRAKEKQEKAYLEACRLQETAKTEPEYKAVIRQFEKLHGYKDSTERLNQCSDAIAEIKKEQRIRKEEKAKAKAEEKEKKHLSKASLHETEKKEVSERNDTENHEKKPRRNIAWIIVLAAVMLLSLISAYILTNSPSFRYKKALNLREKGSYEEAIDVFTALGDYKDAAEQVAATRYAEGLEKREAKDWAGARVAFEQAGDYSDAAEQIASTWYAEGEYCESVEDYEGAETAFQMAGGYLDANDRITEIRYKRAKQLNANGRYGESARIYAQIPDYKDVQKILTNNGELYKAALQMKGSILTFGTYEQDNNQTNGKEPIEWIVLDVKDGMCLLISRYGLDCVHYNSDIYHDVTWETSNVRAWLNDDFLSEAFSAAERARIPLVTIPADKNPRYDIDPGNSTVDQIFLLSIPEANSLFDSDESRLCKSTAYAKANGCYTIGDGICYWWLRSPGSQTCKAAIVDNEGFVDNFGSGDDTNVKFNGVEVGDNYIAVRPALWIDINRIDFTTVGNVVTFGEYEQDNDLSNGKEPVEWIVLDVQDGRSLLLSHYGLDTQPFNTTWRSVTWGTCSLRTWLNDTFLKETFNAEEQMRIPTVTVTADKNPNYSTYPGADTKDRVFLLSAVEAKKYFSSIEELQCEQTAYAEARGCYIDRENGKCLWWLRSPGMYSTAAVHVMAKGYVSLSGTYVYSENRVVRPLLWIDLNS